MNLIEQSLDVIAVVQRGIKCKADLGRKAQTNAPADLAAHEAERTVEPVQRITHLLLIPHNADVDLRFTQILRTHDRGHGHKSDAGIFEFIEDDVTDFLLDQFL